MDFGAYFYDILAPFCPPFGHLLSPKAPPEGAKIDPKISSGAPWPHFGTPEGICLSFWSPSASIFEYFLSLLGNNFRIFLLEATCFEEAYHRGGLGVSPLDPPRCLWHLLGVARDGAHCTPAF